MENNQNKPEGKQELKKQNMALMFDGTLTKYKNENYNPMSKMASTVVNFQMSFGDSMRHFCDYFLRLLPKTKQLPDVPRRYWLEHLECKVKSLVGDIALQDTKIKESYDNLVNLLNGDTTLQISKIQIDNFSNKYLNPTVTPVDSTILTQLECVFKPALEIEANLPTESEYLIARLVEDERKYIEDMEMMVKNYVEVVEAAPIWMPRTLIGHKIRLFGNIEEIFKFHKMVFYPQLLENSDSALKISKIIIIHIIGDAFEPYITFGILHKQIRSWQQQFQVFLDKVQTNCGIKYKYEPNKQLAIYQKFLQLIQKEADQQSSVEVFQKAENKIHLLLVKISNTFKIYYELQSYCLSIPVTFQIELMNMVNQKYGFDLNKPQLFIIPRDDRLYQEPVSKLLLIIIF